MKIFALILLFPGLLGAFAQQKSFDATTTGSCSPATSGSHNNFVIKCGIGPEQGRKILDLLNAALRNQKDVNGKLDELLELALMKPIQLSANVGGIKDLGVQVENKSSRTANGLNWEVMLYRESDLVLLSFPTTDIGYVKAHTKGNYYQLALESKPRVALGGGDTQIKMGDVLTGSISVDCPDCAGVTYVLHLVWGESGWIYGLTDLIGSRLLITPDQTNEGKKTWIQYLKDISPEDKRMAIK